MLILDNLQILTWCMTVAATDQKPIISNYLFRKKGANITGSVPLLPDFATKALLY